MSLHFAYTTYNNGGVGGILNKMQTLDDTIADFTPPVSDKYMREYEQRFRYGEQKHVRVRGSMCHEEFAGHVDERSCLKGRFRVVDLPKRGTERNRKEVLILFK